MIWKNLWSAACAISFILLSVRLFRGTADRIDIVAAGVACIIVVIDIVIEVLERISGKKRMTWKRELAFWAFMFLVMLWFMYGIIHTGLWLSDHWGAYLNVREGR